MIIKTKIPFKAEKWVRAEDIRIERGLQAIARDLA